MLRQPTRPLARLRVRLGEEDGYAGTAIAYPAVVVLCLAIVQFGLYYAAENTAQAATWTAYQQTRAYQATAADGQAAGQQLLDGGSPLTGGRIAITRTADTVTVTTTGTAVTILPGLPLPPITRTLAGPVERWIPG
jgi:hypothetical protein